MTAARILYELKMEGVSVRLDQGKLKLIGKGESVDKIKAIVVEHKAAIIRELSGRASALPDPDAWTCPACKSHHLFWVSAFGLKICSVCHPDPRVLRAEWQAKDGAR